MHACHDSPRWLDPISHPPIVSFIPCSFPAISLPSGHILDFSQVKIYLYPQKSSQLNLLLWKSLWVPNLNLLETFQMSTHFWTIPAYPLFKVCMNTLHFRLWQTLYATEMHRPLHSLAAVLDLLILTVCCLPKQQKFVFNACLCAYLNQREMQGKGWYLWVFPNSKGNAQSFTLEDKFNLFLVLHSFCCIKDFFYSEFVNFLMINGCWVIFTYWNNHIVFMLYLICIYLKYFLIQL